MPKLLKKTKEESKWKWSLKLGNCSINVNSIKLKYSDLMPLQKDMTQNQWGNFLLPQVFSCALIYGKYSYLFILLYPFH